jgi:hypothetical protein
MHLNRECRYPDLSNLFVREDVTEDIADELAQVPQQAAALRTVLANPLPDVPAGDHCHSPYPCPFIDRCNPELPEHHISTLYQIRRHKRDALVADGIETIDQLNPEELPRGPARRQVESVRSGNLVVERGLARALRALRGTVAFLDFETINPPIPMWPGCSPYQALPVQMSCHILSGKRIDHHDWLATGPSDPRPELARALLRACAGAQSIVAWNASFERRCLETLADAVPQLRRKLLAVSDRIHDLLPIVRDHVYHPEFGGSFSLKRVAPALVPELDYDALDIANGSEASAKLEQLILHEDALNAAQAGVLCRELRKYCQLDTLALVKVYQRLRGLR